MNFFNGLKRVEKFLTNVAEAITPEDPPAPSSSFPVQQNPRGYTTSSNQSANMRRAGALHDPSTHSIDQGGTRRENISSLAVGTGGDGDDFSLSQMSTQDDFLRDFSDMLHALRGEILATAIIPTISYRNCQALVTALQQEMNAQVLLRDAQKELEQCQKREQQEQKEGVVNCSIGKKATHQAQMNLEQFQKIARESKDELLNIGTTVLNLVEEQQRQSMSVEMDVDASHQQRYRWELKVLQATILTNATPQQLALYVMTSRNGILHSWEYIHNLLQNPSLMKEILFADGPKDQNYANFLSIYHQICATSSHTLCSGASLPVGTKRSTNAVLGNSDDGQEEWTEKFNIFDRLALAVALEHAKPIKIFDTNITIDPVARYAHYEGAYLRGELDPTFSTLSTWELRMVVNNDASDDEIQWCRDMLRNYRPDHILDRNDAWRYCMIVRTDVDYKRPVWREGYPRTYKQLISGGGMCGPRAWFGRYTCKSFGIPTWGIRQPGHAAMSHWTQSGRWVINLGGNNWKKSWWEARNGVDFHLETLARIWGNNMNCKKYEEILWLQCFAHINHEVQIGSQNADFYERKVENRLWSELCMIQKEIFARNVLSCSSNDATEDLRRQHLSGNNRNELNISTLIESLRRDSDNCDMEIISSDQNGCIIVPASICAIPSAIGVDSGNVIIMKCFHGGKQIHVRDGATFEYQVHVTQTQTYLLHLNIVTVRSQCDIEPLRLRILCSIGGSEERFHDIKIPHSEGEWAKTESVQVELIEEVPNIFQFSSPHGLRITIKDFTLTPSP